MSATWCILPTSPMSRESGELSPCISPRKERSPEGITYFPQMKNMANMDLDTAWVSWEVTCTITQRMFVMVTEGENGVGHHSITCAKRGRELEVLATGSHQPENDHFCTRRGRETAHHAGLSIIKEAYRGRENPLPLLPLPSVSMKAR